MRVEPSDFELMRRSARGDREAYARVFLKHLLAIRRNVFAVFREVSWVEEAVQETFLRGLESAPLYRGEAALAAWFTAIAVNFCRTALSRRKRELERARIRRVAFGNELGRPPGRGVLAEVLAGEAEARLRTAMRSLTAGQRQALVLHYLEGLPYREVGCVLGVDPGAARALAHRAKHNLRQRLDPDLRLAN